MDFSSILLRNTRLMAVLRNLFALLVSVDVVYCQHAGIRMFRPKACSPDGDSPGTIDDSPDDTR